MDEWTAGGTTIAGVLTALVVWLRRRRKKGGPRLRLRGGVHWSFRTHSNEPTHSTEPPPFPPSEEANTLRPPPRKGRRGD